MIAVIVIMSLFFFLQANKQTQLTSEEISALATCLNESGSKFYGAFWCSHCNNQKALFGEAKELLPYIECSEADGKSQTPICKANNINSYPTWVFADGTQVGGEQSFDSLAERSGCKK